jgi:hypothetical protein
MSDAETAEDLARARIAAGDPRGALEALRGAAVHLNAHDPDGPGCLCPECVGAPTLELDGARFVLDLACARGRALLFWLPVELEDDRDAVRDRVARRLDELLTGGRRYDARDLTLSPWRLRSGR